MFSRNRSSVVGPGPGHDADRALSVAVWAHHVRHRGGQPAVLLLYDLPDCCSDRCQVLQLGRHHVGRRIAMRTPMLWAVGFLTTFLFGGLTGIVLASPPLTSRVSMSLLVAHFHYVVFGTVVFAMFAGFYFWWPKLTGRMLDETLGKIHLAAVHRIPRHLPHPALARRGGNAAAMRITCPATVSPSGTRSPRQVRSCSAPQRWSSSGTSGRAGTTQR